jgi:hypothetical protein
VKNRNRGMQSTPFTVPPPFSPGSCRRNVDSSVHTRPRHDHSARCDSLGSHPSVGNPSPGPRVGVIAPLPPPMKDKAFLGSHIPISSDCPASTPDTQSPSLVHFPDYNALTPCHLMETNLGMHKDLWSFCLIGYIAGKFPRYTPLTKFINSSWKCKAKFSMHDSGWLIFTLF